MHIADTPTPRYEKWLQETFVVHQVGGVADHFIHKVLFLFTYYQASGPVRKVTRHCDVHEIENGVFRFAVITILISGHYIGPGPNEIQSSGKKKKYISGLEDIILITHLIYTLLVMDQERVFKQTPEQDSKGEINILL